MKKISGDFRFFRCKKIRVQCSVSRIQRGSRIRIQFFGNVEALVVLNITGRVSETRDETHRKSNFALKDFVADDLQEEEEGVMRRS